MSGVPRPGVRLLGPGEGDAGGHTGVVLSTTALREQLEAVADRASAPAMSAYMKHRFGFLGVKAPARRAAAKPTMTAARSATGDELCRFARACWDQPEREFQYVGADLLRANVGRLESRHLDDVGFLIVTRSWWDTVDSLAAWTVGPLVRADPALVSRMDRWIDDDDIWLARSAILHQLHFGADTDAERLFDHARRRAGDTEFFIRKALGWALRQYARTDPDAVRSFVLATDLSGLTRREALKHL